MTSNHPNKKKEKKRKERAGFTHAPPSVSLHLLRSSRAWQLALDLLLSLCSSEEIRTKNINQMNKRQKGLGTTPSGHTYKMTFQHLVRVFSQIAYPCVKESLHGKCF